MYVNVSSGRTLFPLCRPQPLPVEALDAFLLYAALRSASFTYTLLRKMYLTLQKGYFLGRFVKIIIWCVLLVTDCFHG